MTQRVFAFVKLSDMSTAQIVAELKSLSSRELDELDSVLQQERLSRRSSVLSQEQSRLLGIINHPLPQSGRYKELRSALESEVLTKEERQELCQITDAREIQSAERVAAVLELAKLKNEPFDKLWQSMVGAPQGKRPIVD